MSLVTSKVPPFAAPVARAIDNLDALIQRGLGVDSPDIIFVKQPDGRLVPKLHPALVPKTISVSIGTGYFYGSISDLQTEVTYDIILFSLAFAVRLTKVTMTLSGAYADMSVLWANTGMGADAIHFLTGPYSRTDLSPDQNIPLPDGEEQIHTVDQSINAGGLISLNPFDVDTGGATLTWRIDFTSDRDRGGILISDPGPTS